MSYPEALRRRPPAAVFGRRLRCVRLVMVTVFLLVVWQLVEVQVLRSGRYQAAASEELTQTVSVPALRGGIYDRNGDVLALSVPTKTVVADDFQIQDPDAEAARLAPLLGVPAAQLASLLHRHDGYVPLARDISAARASKVSALTLPGITMVADSNRIDPDGSLASPVLGSVHSSGAGASGIEYELNSQLAGKAGSETLLESPSGVALPGSSVSEHTSAHPGTGIELTLDEPLQYETEQALASEIASTGAVSGTAVVMDVHTGDILSMADLTSNAAGAASPSPVATAATSGASGKAVTIGPGGPVSEAPSNLAVTQLFEPGSVFKLVTFSAALQDGVITPDSVFSVPDQRELDGSSFHDAETHPTEDMTATQIIAQSSNIGTSEIAQELGESKLLAQVKTLGFGEMTGLGFPGEQSGIIAGAAQWEPTDYVSLPIGQVDAVNALQLLDAYNAVANGGVLVRPRLVQATVGSDGTAVATPPSPTHRVVPAGVSGELRQMLEQVVDDGTGTSAAIPGYMVAGKTGTAEIPSTTQAGYVPGAYMATFVGFAPATHPVLSAIVVLDRPVPIYGGTVAAPVFSEIMSDALHRFDIPTTPGMPAGGQVQSTAESTELAAETG